MEKYLDPKNDFVFKRVFGEHKNLCISLLNGLLPLSMPIESIEYNASELVPDLPGLKDSIVDVHCRDSAGRQFIVEMQMHWTRAFMQRVLFNASKAYVRQLKPAQDYNLLQPVYSLNLVNDKFLCDTENFYHHYKIVNVENSEQQIKGLEFVFVELPKFKPNSAVEKKMAVLWLRYLTEVGETNQVVAEDLLQNSEIGEALQCVRESSYGLDELEIYEKVWDAISTKNTLLSGAFQDGVDKGMERGIARGKIEEKTEIALSLLKKGFSIDDISAITGLPRDIVNNFNQQKNDRY